MSVLQKNYALFFYHNRFSIGPSEIAKSFKSSPYQFLFRRNTMQWACRSVRNDPIQKFQLTIFPLFSPSGKTTILYKLKLNEEVRSIPTIGFNREMVSPMPGLTFSVWDVGGQQKVRQMWRDLCYQGTQGKVSLLNPLPQQMIGRHILTTTGWAF